MPPFTTDGSLILGPQTLSSMPAKLRHELLTHVFPGLSDMLVTNDPDAPPVDEEDQDGSVLVDFTDAEFLTLLAGCSEKTRQVLATLAEGGRQFDLTALAQKVNMPAGKLGGVWSGLTRRTRNLKKNPDAAFVTWEWDAKSASWVGTLSEITHAAMKKAFA
jgi:hypothetical protein